jgi:hypothetical protein
MNIALRPGEAVPYSLSISGFGNGEEISTYAFIRIGTRRCSAR